MQQEQAGGEAGTQLGHILLQALTAKTPHDHHHLEGGGGEEKGCGGVGPAPAPNDPF
jgi:hypothetical protein